MPDAPPRFNPFDFESVTQGFQDLTDFRDHRGTKGPVPAGVDEKPDPKTAGEEEESKSVSDSAAKPGGTLASLLEELRTEGLKFSEYVRRLFDESLTLMGPGEWQSVILPFVRWVRCHPDMEGLTGPEGWRKVRAVVLSWRPKVPDEWWENFFFCTEEDAEVELLHWWDRLKSLPTADPIEYALQLADETPLKLLKEVAATRSKGYPRFVSLCGYLQFNVGPRTPIFLPVRKVGQVLGVQPMSVSRYIENAVKDGYLEKVADAVFRPKGQSLAAAFRFKLSKFDCLKR